MRLSLTAVILLLCAGSASADSIAAFRTPSDNIHCSFIEFNGVFLSCEIRDRGGNEPVLPAPADCDLEWGDRFDLQAGSPASLSCHGDTIRVPDAPVLGYGMQIEKFGITCMSADTGLTCRDGNGNGFFLSKARQEIF